MRQTASPLYTTVDSPLGELLLTMEGESLSGLYLEGGRKPAAVGPSWERAPHAFDEPRRQLNEYFLGDRTAFDLTVAIAGSPFQLRVWRALRQIPYGETLGYGELAALLGVPRAARAVGAANGANPLSIIVPCHRLVGASGAMTDYAGGVEAKRSLLEFEAGRIDASGLSPCSRWREP